MTRPQQLDLLARAQVIVGLHSDDIRGALWMPGGEQTTVIELFEQDGFVRESANPVGMGARLNTGDYELLVTTLGHRHIAFQRDHTIGKEVWGDWKGSKRGDEAKGEVSLDAAALVGVIRGLFA